MDILAMLKTLLNIELIDISKDEILNYMLENSKIKISRYLRVLYTKGDVIFETNYLNVIVELAKYDYKNQKATGIKQYTESKRSVTYRDAIDSIPGI
ncbi:phage head-tail connector protein [Clostridium sp. CM027]|uniref:phage head-tail connector protein n=1 Tax=Clostridium sp. CM027 TaxID=2849865 RepID=UPI001C6E9695|nr:phage head-tail connector protein [Clostridium sp. CM027]MBW9147300.1 phage head-tail connector protein [Clostridium sp. CM027]UVE41392.1 phage head-tail connector protein [Clostridium sp. CM027]